jgi:DNA mismatch repair protein MutL
VNGRLIRSQTLSQAFSEGFDPLVPRGRHPYVYAHLRLDPAALDVNIHPTKAEVRFANDRAPFRAVYHAIKESLEAETAETLKLGAWESVLDGGAGIPFSTPVPVTPPGPLVTGRPAGGGLSEPSLGQVGDAFPDRGYATPRMPARTAQAGRVMELYRPPSGKELDFELALAWPPETFDEGPEQLSLQTPPTRVQPRLRYLSSLYRSYLVMEVDGELWVVDQHAAHERVQYERLHRFQIVGPQSQGLVVPLSVALTPVERETLESQGDRFAEVGFELELAGRAEVLLKAVPPGLPAGKVAGFFSELLSELAEEGLSVETPVAQYREKLRAMMACKSSIRARESISEQEALRLVADLIEAERSPYCPHGRPTRIRLDLPALERLFQRS